MALADPNARIEMTMNDGSIAALQATVPTVDIPSGDFWMFLPEFGAYGSVLDTDIDVQNTATDVYCFVLRSFGAFMCHRPVKVGSQMAAGFKASSFKMIDDDPTNFLNNDATNYTIAYEAPDVNVLGGKLVDVRIALDVDMEGPPNAVAVDFGLWDTNVAAWVNAKKHSYTSAATGRRGLISSAANAYVENDVTSAVRPDFRDGRLMDTGSPPKHLEIRATITTAQKAVTKWYGVALVARIETPGKFVDSKSILTFDPGYNIHNHELDAEGSTPIIVQKVTRRQGSVQGTQFLFGGKCQKDDLSGTYTGTASALIQKAPDIARHILQKLGAYSVNATSGMLGNFVDARAEGVTGEKIIAPYFGIEPVSLGEALADLQHRWPMRLAQADGVWNVILDEMNPNVNRMYRSSTDAVRISARRDIIEGSLSVSEAPIQGIQNDIELRYAHAYGTNKAMGVATYAHPLSQETFYYGARPTLVVDEPWVPRLDLLNDNPHPAATYLIQWLGRRNARPRLMVKLRLGPAYLDLRRGHVLEFDDDMETMGYFCPAYRCGMLDYHFVSSASITNYANSGTPTLISASGTGEVYFMASQQYPSLTFSVGTAAAYTVVANPWEYYDGAAWVTHSNVVNPDGLKSTGAQLIGWDRPTLTSWKKAELTIGGFQRGPGYWTRMKYSTATVAGLGNARTAHPATWRGRLFEITELSVRFPEVDVVLQEVM